MTQGEAQTYVRQAVAVKIRRESGLTVYESEDDKEGRHLIFHEASGKLYDERDGSTYIVEIRELS